MRGVRKLLVPLDGSESAHRALAWASAFAQATGKASLHLVHVGAGAPTGEESALLQRAERELREKRVPFTSEVLRGPVAATIAEHAAREGCDGIVMGTRGMSPIEDLVVGSIAAKVVQLTRLPVTLVK